MLADAPARAQVAGGVTLQNDDEFRGYSLSDHHPVATFSLSYENTAGLYVNGAATGAMSGDGDPTVLNMLENIGYARRLNSVVSIDGGVIRSDYFEHYGALKSKGYTEAYLGLVGDAWSSHIYLSPNYFGRGARTLYGEAEYTLPLPGEVYLGAHLGLLDVLSGAYRAARPPPEFDWRLTASRRFGAFDLHAAVSGGGPGAAIYYQGPRPGTALVVGAGWTF